nr:GntR family transcriptional regulator [Streptomyces sp. SID8377]
MTRCLRQTRPRSAPGWPRANQHRRPPSDVIIKRITDGAYLPGSKVPSVVQIAAEFGVVNSTAQRAMERVRAEGLTRSEEGMGT